MSPTPKKIMITSSRNLVSRMANQFYVLPSTTDRTKEKNISSEETTIRIRNTSIASRNSLVRTSSHISLGKSDNNITDSILADESKTTKLPVMKPIISLGEKISSGKLLKTISKDNTNFLKQLANAKLSKPRPPISLSETKQENHLEFNKLKAKTVFAITTTKDKPELPVKSLLSEFSLQTIQWEGTDFPEIHKRLIFSKVLGSGAFAKVYQAIDVPTGHHVAVKVMDKNTIRNHKWKRLIEKELEILSIINHPNICSFYRMVETETKVVYQ